MLSVRAALVMNVFLVVGIAVVVVLVIGMFEIVSMVLRNMGRGVKGEGIGEGPKQDVEGGTMGGERGGRGMGGGNKISIRH